MAAEIAGVERALGAIGTTFRLTRLYPATHPAVIEALRQITGALPALAALGTVDLKIGATGFHWSGQHLLPRNVQVAELAGLLYARGVRTVQAHPGVAAEHVLALFGVATGTVAADDAGLGQLTLGLGRRSQRVSSASVRAAPGLETSAPAASAQAPPSPPPQGPDVAPRRSSAAFRPDVVPADVEVKRAIANLKNAKDPASCREAVAKLAALTPTLLGLRDVGIVSDAIGALDQALGPAQDPELIAAIGAAAHALADRPVVERMVSRLGEPLASPAEREALVAALGALASLSIGAVLNAYLAAPVGGREPYRAVVRRAGERALEGLQGRLADKEPGVVAGAAELLGLTGAPQVVALLMPLLRHQSDFVREAALTGLAEIGGREISRPIMPALKDPSVVVRAAAARAIAVAGDAGATTVLVRRLEQEDDEGVLAELLRSIGRLGARESLEALARYAEPGGMLRRRSPTVRAAAVEGLGRVTSPEARGLLELYTHDKEPAVRKAAEAALR